jgi:uncharacterized Zn finger protein
MSGIPKLSEQTIRRRFDERSYERGRAYFEEEAIFDARRQGQTLKARCHGSSAPSYRVSVMLGGKGIAGAECSCPVGSSGFCKHVAALLLTWREHPEAFVEVEEPDAVLERLGKEELIALIKQMVRREPDLEMLLEAAGRPPSADTYHAQASAAFANADDGWNAIREVADHLDAIRETGDDSLKKKDWVQASVVYEGILRAISDAYETVQDEEGELHSIVEDCVAGLGKCLPQISEHAARREGVLRALWLISRLDVEQGGIFLGEDAPELLLKHARGKERQLISKWIREAMPAGASHSDDYHREIYGGWLEELEVPSDAVTARTASSESPRKRRRSRSAARRL